PPAVIVWFLLFSLYGNRTILSIKSCGYFVRYKAVICVPHLIFKCPYIRGGSKKVAAHLSNYVRYMATREGAQRIAADKAQLPATKKQQQMVEQLLRDFPLSRGTFEYEDYAAAPT